MVHGGGYKPDRLALQALWHEALAAGLDRDYAEAGGRSLLDDIAIELAYYGDVTNPVVESTGDAPDAALDLQDRLRDLRRLSALSSRKEFRLAHYEAVPGKSAVGELIADVTAPMLHALRLTSPVLSRKLPSLAAYLASRGHPQDGGIRATCEERLMQALVPALRRGDDVLLVSHGMGSVVSHDALWRLSHDPEVSGGPALGRVRTWVTLGSPLANEYVKSNLRGARDDAERRFPNRMVNWFNIAAEDDYHCHDKTVANDFAALLRQRLISQIHDYRIYNLAVRYGRSNPHNSVGYLIHPRLTRILAEWLGSEVTG